MGLLLIALSLAFPLPGHAAPADKAYPCYRAPSAPTIDGDVLGDPAWQVIPCLTGFRVLGGSYTQAKQTTARACWDDEALYVAMVCEEPDAAALKPAVRDGGPTWQEDSIEIFLQPKANGQVYQFGVTAGGAKGMGEGNPDIGKCAAAAKIGQVDYGIEIRIPFGVVDARPAVGDQWLVTFCRNIFTTLSGGDKFTNWAPLLSRFLEPEHFLPMVLSGSAPDAAGAAQETEALNAPYRKALLTELRSAAKQGTEYRGALAQAAGHPRFAEEAGKLLHQWEDVERVNQEVDQASLPNIREAIASARSLVADSYRVKYEYLIAKLLEE